MTYTPEQIEEWKLKAEKWDILYAEIEKCYYDEDGNEVSEDEGGDLLNIGEKAAYHLGFM